MPANESSALSLFLGHLHPLLVHFPIALTIAAALFEVMDWTRGGGRGFTRRQASPLALRCLGLAALGAVAAGVTGWIAAEVDPPGTAMGETLTWHRWTGVTVTVLTLSALAFAALDRLNSRSGFLGLYRLVLVAAALLVGYGGYLGGTLVHGHGHLTSMFGSGERTEEEAAPREPMGGEAPTRAAAMPPPTAPASANPHGKIDFAAQAAPTFAARCVECHGPLKQKGQLRLDELAYVLEKRGVVEPGDALASELYRRVSLPTDHEDRMPAKGDPLSADEIRTIRTWIDQMAPSTN